MDSLRFTLNFSALNDGIAKLSNTECARVVCAYVPPIKLSHDMT